MSAARREWPPAADTFITDPETGLPVLTESLDIDHIAACRGWCNQGRQPCKTPHVCTTGRTLHRIVEVLSHPDDERLKSKTLDELADEDFAQLRALAVVIVCLIVTLFAWVHVVAGLPVVPAAVTGSYHVWPPGLFKLLNFGRITLTFTPAIYSDDPDELLTRAHAQVAEVIAEYEAQSRQQGSEVES